MAGFCLVMKPLREESKQKTANYPLFVNMRLTTHPPTNIHFDKMNNIHIREFCLTLSPTNVHIKDF